MWKEDSLKRIEDLTKDWSISKYNLNKMTHLVRMIELIDENRSNCSECRLSVNDIDRMIQLIPTIEREGRSEYEQLFLKIQAHFYEGHDMKPPQYYTGRYSLISIAIGLLLMVIASFAIWGRINIDLLMYGSIIALGVGYVIGLRKDKKILFEGRAL